MTSCGHHLADFMAAFNFARGRKALSSLAPYEMHLQDLDIRAGQIHLEPDPLDAGNEHLGPPQLSQPSFS